MLHRYLKITKTSYRNSPSVRIAGVYWRYDGGGDRAASQEGTGPVPDREVHSLESHSTPSVWTADCHGSHSQRSSDQEQDGLSEATCLERENNKNVA